MSSRFVILLAIAVFGAYVCCGAEECPPNSERRQCGSICEPTCKDPREIRCKIDPTNCTMDCRCLSGYVRNKETNNCVKVEDCAGSDTTTASTDGADNA